MPVSPTSTQMYSMFRLCRQDRWRSILNTILTNPEIALTPMIMDNHIATTIVHQAITSKSHTAIRAKVIATILEQTPTAASIRNGYGSLPLHVIAQRNTKMDSQTKERLILMLVRAHPSALTAEGGVGKRTPLHIAFTDYISPRLAQTMIKYGSEATRMKDRKGWLPAHVACSRHCSPEKLRMLLEANPEALHATTDRGKTLLQLAKDTATRTHPNYALIAELKRQLQEDESKQLFDDFEGGKMVRLKTEEDIEDEHNCWGPAMVPRQMRSHTCPTPPIQRSSEAADLLMHFSRSSADLAQTNTGPTYAQPDYAHPPYAQPAYRPVMTTHYPLQVYGNYHVSVPSRYMYQRPSVFPEPYLRAIRIRTDAEGVGRVKSEPCGEVARV